jgi:mRNA interferase MazF
MKRGEIWTVSGAGYAGKPRPAVIIQSDRFGDTMSITICIFTTSEPDAPLARLSITLSAHNWLRAPCYLMVDKITTVPKTQLGDRIGDLEAESMTQLKRAIFVFLGLGARSARGHMARRSPS